MNELFISNKYTKWYFSIIKNAISQNRKKFEGTYFESHHIIPRSLGGIEEVLLTAKEHFICHWLLTKMCKSKEHTNKMIWALHRMAFSIPSEKNRTSMSAKSYEICRKLWSKYLTENHPAKIDPEKWSDTARKTSLEYWDDEDRSRERRENLTKHSPLRERIRKPGDLDYDEFMEEQRRRAKNGAQRAAEIVSRKIEYFGVTYKGWNNFTKETGITKCMYNKYYLNGFKIPMNKDGPLSVDEIQELIVDYCYKTNKIVPSKKDELEVLKNMKQLGIIAERQFNNYLRLKGESSDD